MSARLESEVWSMDNCAGCGLCVASCSKQVLHWNGGHHPTRETRTKRVGYTNVPLDSCTFCQHFCEEVCPRLERWAPLEPIEILTARAHGPIKSGTPNDVIRSILTAGRSAGLLDGVVMLDLDPWTLQPLARVANTVEEIVSSVGPQFLWAPLFDALNEAVFDRGMENLAIVGTPCTAQAIRRLKASANPFLQPYENAIRVTMAVFCTGTYRPEMIDEVFIRRMAIPRDQIKRIEVSEDREWIQAILWNGEVHSAPLQEAEKYALHGCGSCDDYLGESADLAIGALGAPEGSSTLIIRTHVGETFIRNALQMRLLEISREADIEILNAAAGEKDRRERAQTFKDLRLLMLDALADPLQRSEAIKQFVHLYRTPMRSKAPEKAGNACTGC
jgi:coenzyme F420 hydrogenase subunit beta